MYGGVTLTGPVGAMVIFVMQLTMLGSLWLAWSAVRRQPRPPRAFVPWLLVCAAMVSNAASHLWPTLSPLAWVVIPLQLLSMILAGRVLLKHRHVGPPGDPEII